jgi:hypothetical protein
VRVDEAGGLLGGEVDDGRVVVDGDVLGDAGEREREIDKLRLADGERDSGAALLAESGGVGGDGVAADGDRRRGVAAIGAGLEMALVARLVVVDQDGGVGDGCAGGVGDCAGDGSADDLRGGVRGEGDEQGEKNVGEDCDG